LAPAPDLTLRTPFTWHQRHRHSAAREVDVVPPRRRIVVVQQPHHVHVDVNAVALRLLRLRPRGPDLVVVLGLLEASRLAHDNREGWESAAARGLGDKAS
jgi:hypothetical protein